MESRATSVVCVLAALAVGSGCGSDDDLTVGTSARAPESAPSGSAEDVSSRGGRGSGAPATTGRAGGASGNAGGAAGSAGETGRGGSPEAQGGSAGEAQDGGEVGGGGAGTSGTSGTSGSGGGGNNDDATGGSGAAGASGSGAGMGGGGATSGDGSEGCPEGWTGAACDVCVIYVKNDSGSDANDGRSWARAKATLQAGIDAAATSPERCDVWVARGIYVPTYKADVFAPSNSATLLLRDGSRLFGGFAGRERSLSSRDLDANETIITGEIGTSDLGDNLVQVVTSAPGAVLDGLTITAGYGGLLGGGIYCGGGDLTISNCTLWNNSAGSGAGLFVDAGCSASVTESVFHSNTVIDIDDATGGGAIYSQGALSIQDSTFSSNRTLTQEGGAIFSRGPLHLRDTAFIANTSAGQAGAVYSGNVTTIVEGCTFVGNRAVATAGALYALQGAVVRQSSFGDNAATGSAAARGGAIYTPDALQVEDTSFIGNHASGGTKSNSGGALHVMGPLWVERSIFRNNQTTGSAATGGAIACAGCVSQIVSSTFDANGVQNGAATLGHGGAIYVRSDAFEVHNSVFTQNFAASGGGAISDRSSPSSLHVQHCSFYGNRTGGQGGAIFVQQGHATFSHSILWSNSAAVDGHQILADLGAAVTVRACNVQGTGFDGTDGNIDAEPLFVSTTEGSLDLRLQAGSPCIDAGAGWEIAADVLDLDGDGDVTDPLPFDVGGAARVQGGAVDLGAYESSL